MDRSRVRKNLAGSKAVTLKMPDFSQLSAEIISLAGQKWVKVTIGEAGFRTHTYSIVLTPEGEPDKWIP